MAKFCSVGWANFGTFRLAVRNQASILGKFS
jgi:hypothetical protein